MAPSIAACAPFWIALILGRHTLRGIASQGGSALFQSSQRGAQVRDSTARECLGDDGRCCPAAFFDRARSYRSQYHQRSFRRGVIWIGDPSWASRSHIARSPRPFVLVEFCASEGSWQYLEFESYIARNCCLRWQVPLSWGLFSSQRVRGLPPFSPRTRSRHPCRFSVCRCIGTFCLRSGRNASTPERYEDCTKGRHSRIWSDHPERSTIVRTFPGTRRLWAHLGIDSCSVGLVGGLLLDIQGKSAMSD